MSTNTLSNNNTHEKRRFIRLVYDNISSRPYILAFELKKDSLPSKKGILFSGAVIDISVNGIRIGLSESISGKNFVGKHLLFSLSFQNTNFQRWVQGKVLYVKDNMVSVTLSKTSDNTVSFDDGTSCRTSNLIPIEILNKEQEFLLNVPVNSTWLTDTCKKNIDTIFDNPYSSENENLFNKSISSIINGIVTTYFFNLTDIIDNNMPLETFIDKYKVKFDNNSEYSMSFDLSCMRDEHIFIPNSYGDTGTLFRKELNIKDFSHLFKKNWQRFDLKIYQFREESKSLGKQLFEEGVEYYMKHGENLFPDPGLKLAGDAYVEQLSMYMEGRQKEISEIFEISPTDLL